MQRFFLVISILSVLFINTAFAVRVTSLYHAKIPVASQSPADRNKVLSQGLTQVLIKVGGDSRMMNRPVLQAGLETAGSLMQAFSYSTVGGANNQYLLDLQFDSDGVNKLLREAAVPIWGEDRPLILSWIVFEAPKHPPEIIDSDSNHPIQTFMKAQADQRGLPLIFPTMDITDINQVSINNIQTMTVPILQNAAKRYASDAILMIRIKQLPDGFNAQAKLVLGKDAWDWNITDKTLPNVLTPLIDSLTNTLSARYATVVTSSVHEKLALKVTGIASEEDSSRLLHYLQNLTSVAHAEIARIEGGDVVLNINLRGNREAFTQALSLGNKLTPVTDQANELVYQWNH
jgi:uncharacterized protein